MGSESWTRVWRVRQGELQETQQATAARAELEVEDAGRDQETTEADEALAAVAAAAAADSCARRFEN